MRILLIHNYYQQPGGEDVVFRAEKALLERMGHNVITFVEDNTRLNAMGHLQAAMNAVWSKASQKRLHELIQESRPDVAHSHNTFLMISPAVYYTCKADGVPVVHSLHNQRIFCPKATMFREGRVCDACVGRFYPWPALKYKCYHGSFMQTFVAATMVFFHQWLRTWHRKIDLYITFTEFFRHRFIEWGLPASKIVVKPHFVYPDPGVRALEDYGNYALFVGRLDPEKGVHTLVNAWRLLSDVPLKIRGNGRLYQEVRILAETNSNVSIIHRLAREDLIRLIKGARFLVWPSLAWYENFGLIAIEAFACGVPVIASNTGAMAEIVEHARTGLLFEPGNAEDLAAKVEWAWTHPEQMAEMGREARKEYERKYTAERNYEMLMAIYRRAIQRVK